MSKSKRRIKRDAGGRNKKPKAQLDQLEVKPSRTTYIKFTRQK